MKIVNILILCITLFCASCYDVKEPAGRGGPEVSPVDSGIASNDIKAENSDVKAFFRLTPKAKKNVDGEDENQEEKQQTDSPELLVDLSSGKWYKSSRIKAEAFDPKGQPVKQEGIHTYWSDQYLFVQIRGIEEAGLYGLGVMAKNFSPSVLPPDYKYFNISVTNETTETDVGGILIEASDNIYNYGKVLLDLPRGDTDLLLKWTNDLHDPGKFDADINILSIYLSLEKSASEPEKMLTRSSSLMPHEYSTVDGRFFWDKEGVKTYWSDQTLGFKFPGIKPGVYKVTVHGKSTVIPRGKNGPKLYEVKRLEELLKLNGLEKDILKGNLNTYKLMQSELGMDKDDDIKDLCELAEKNEYSNSHGLNNLCKEIVEKKKTLKESENIDIYSMMMLLHQIASETKKASKEARQSAREQQMLELQEAAKKIQDASMTSLINGIANSAFIGVGGISTAIKDMMSMMTIETPGGEMKKILLPVNGQGIGMGAAQIGIYEGDQEVFLTTGELFKEMAGEAAMASQFQSQIDDMNEQMQHMQEIFQITLEKLRDFTEEEQKARESILRVYLTKSGKGNKTAIIIFITGFILITCGIIYIIRRKRAA